MAVTMRGLRDLDKKVVYLDHPLGEKDELGDDGFALRTRNIENAGRWLRWLIEQTPFAVLVPWWAFIAVADEDSWKPRLLTDQRFMITRCCDLLIQCGSHISPHMRDNEEQANRRHLPVACLIPYGPFPPNPGSRSYNRAMAELLRASRM